MQVRAPSLTEKLRFSPPKFSVCLPDVPDKLRRVRYAALLFPPTHTTRNECNSVPVSATRAKTPYSSPLPLHPSLCLHSVTQTFTACGLSVAGGASSSTPEIAWLIQELSYCQGSARGFTVSFSVAYNK